MRALLEEEEGADELTAEDAAVLLRRLRRGARGMDDLFSSEKLQGFIWGVGAATLLMLVLPSTKEKLRPFAVSAAKGALDLADRLKSVVAEAGEGLQDILAEAQFNRFREAAEPGGQEAAAEEDGDGEGG